MIDRLKIYSYTKGIYIHCNAYRIILGVKATSKSAKRHFHN